MKKTNHNSIIKQPKSFKLTSLAFAVATSMASFNAMATMEEYVAGMNDKTVSIEDGKTISGTSINISRVERIYAGKSKGDGTSGNKIEAKNMASFWGKLFAAYTSANYKLSKPITANTNIVNYTGTGEGSSIAGNIIAGQATKGAANKNEVHISGVKRIYTGNTGGNVFAEIRGGWAGTPTNIAPTNHLATLKAVTANGNKITVTGVDAGTTVESNIYAGTSISAEASNNEITFTNIAETKGKTEGAYNQIIAAQGNGRLNKNTVSITGIAEGAVIKSNIHAASLEVGDEVSENEVILKNIKEIKAVDIMGAQAKGKEAVGGDFKYPSVLRKNAVTIEGIGSGAILSTRIVGGMVQQGHVTGNLVSLKNVKEINGKVYAGLNQETDSEQIINSIRSVGDPEHSGDTGAGLEDEKEMQDAVASGNKVEIIGVAEGATLNDDIFGGVVEKDSVRNGVMYLNNNEIFLENVRSSKKETNVYAALAHSLDAKKVEEMNFNKITISGNSDLAKTNIIGALAYQTITDGASVGTVLKSDFTNNVLYIGSKTTPWKNTKGDNAVRSIQGVQRIVFQNLNWNEEKAALKIIKQSDLSNTIIDASGIHFSNKNELIAAGKKMTLIDTNGNDDGIKEENLNGHYISDDPDGYAYYTVGTTLEGKGKPILAENGKDVLYVIKQKDDGGDQGGGKTDPSDPDVIVQEQTHNVMIGNIASLTAVNGGQNFVERALTSNLEQHQYGSHLYFATSGGYDKYKTGSHIKTNVWNANLSMVNSVKLASGDLAYLAGFEYGTGSYDVKGDGINGDGDVDYQGLTLGSKYRHNSGFYTEGAVRVGYVKNKANNVLTDGKKAYSYQTSGYYAGGHLGFGYILSLNENLNLDLYSQYRYMNIEKDKFNAGGEYKLDAIESSIAKAGFRLNQAYNNWHFAYGLGVEHQFDGEAKGTAEGYGIKSADIGGTSGVVEFSATLKPSVESPWSFNFGVDGYVGRHQGARGNLGLSYQF